MLPSFNKHRDTMKALQFIKDLLVNLKELLVLRSLKSSFIH